MFRKKCHTVRLAGGGNISVDVSKVLDESEIKGVLRHSVFRSSLQEIADNNVLLAEDFSLDNQLLSGVPLQEVDSVVLGSPQVSDAERVFAEALNDAQEQETETETETETE